MALELRRGNLLAEIDKDPYAVYFDYVDQIGYEAYPDSPIKARRAALWLGAFIGVLEAELRGSTNSHLADRLDDDETIIDYVMARVEERVDGYPNRSQLGGSNA